MSATLRGVVLDSSGHPVAGAVVCVKSETLRTLNAPTDAAGAYRFPALRPGDYILTAKMDGYSDATLGPVPLAQHESKTIDLTLEPAKKTAAQSSSSARPEFSDEPNFIVAGVTDTTNLGGHGSSVFVTNREELAKATASLSHPAPSSAAIATNPAAEKALRDAVERQSTDGDANFRLGKLLVDEGKADEGLVYLERASRQKPDNYDYNYELALARAQTGEYSGARKDVQSLLNKVEKTGQDRAEPHHLMADVCEKLNHPLEAVREYQRAAELSPTEAYLFDWGAELLLHHAAEPALEVFKKGNRLFPGSARMLAGTGAAWYALGSYDQAVQSLCEASDLNPDELNPYLFLGKIQVVENAPSPAIADRLDRFVKLHPENALANYYYAVSVWKRRKSSEDAESFAKANSALEKAVQLDPTLGVAYMQLGILYSEQKDFSGAIAAYQQAIEATPDSEDAHYRLAQAYGRAGEPSKAQAELRQYEEISKQKTAEIERQRHEVQQFVYQLRDQPSSSPRQ
ncbi:MAG TPA: tetratricopeptide repeat protein [Candidatus Acidoferrum sp.]|nr:tetratricopeptide repeat protein [Candidatus Acidoferrum sp.]